MKELKVGMAKADITPELGCRLYGYVDIRHARRVLDPLSINVIALEQNGEKVLLFSAEICALNLDLCNEMRETISKATGVKKDNIIYSCIHTHSGPITRSSAGWGTTDMNYINGTLVPRSIEVANKALSSMCPAVMGIGKAESLAGINRRELDANGEVILGQNPDGPYDPTMTVVTFKTTDGDTIGTMIHFASHPTAVGINLSITRDWPGYMIDRIEQITGAPCMYINGAEGNVGPRLSNGKTYADEFYLEENGLIAAEDAERAYHTITDFKVPDLKVKTDIVELLYAPIPTLEELEKELASMDPDNLYLTEKTRYPQLQKLKEIRESGEELPTGRKVEQTVLALDELAMVPYAFEVFSDIGLALRARSPFADTLLLGLTGGSFAYLPTKEQIPYGGYEINSFHASSVPPFDDSLADYLLDQNIALLTELYHQK